jgi:hypothetical protein
LPRASVAFYTSADNRRTDPGIQSVISIAFKKTMSRQCTDLVRMRLSW